MMKYGLVDISGREVVPCNYDDISGFSEGLAVVSFEGKDGFIDTAGRIVIPCNAGYC